MSLPIFLLSVREACRRCNLERPTSAFHRRLFREWRWYQALRQLWLRWQDRNTRRAARVHVPFRCGAAWGGGSHRCRSYSWNAARSCAATIELMGFAWSCGRISYRADALRDLPESDSTADRWRCGEDRVLGSLHQSREVSGFRGELCAPWVSSAMVRAVATLHVSMSWRRVLRGWFACCGTAAPRAVRVPVEDRRGQSAD